MYIVTKYKKTRGFAGLQAVELYEPETGIKLVRDKKGNWVQQ